MNELVLCIGKSGDEIKWSKAFSWAHSAELTADIQSEVMSLDSISKLTPTTWNILYEYLDSNLYRFERRSFDEFDYLTVEPKIGAKIFIYIFALIISIGVNIFIINNDQK